LAFAEEVGPGVRGAQAKGLFENLDQRYGELLAAMEWFIDGERADKALRLASALTPFWMATKRLEEGCAWFDRALAAPGVDRHRGRALFDAGYLAFWKGDYEKSAALQSQAVEMGRSAGDPTVTALALVGLARIALRTDVEEARKLCREALAATEGTEDRAGRSSAMHVLGVAAQMAGDLQEAREVMGRRIALAREEGNTAVISVESGNLSMVERQLGNLDRAEALAREALEIDIQRGDGFSVSWKVNGLAAVAADRGELERAATLVGIADRAMEAAGGSWPPDELAQYKRTVAILTESLGPTGFERAQAAGRAMSASDGVAYALRRGAAG
jgi:non-specific serine/threonine protein kinase